MKKWQFLIYMLLGFVFIGTIYFAIVNYNSTKEFVLQSVERETDELLNSFITEVDRFALERTSDIKLLVEHIPYMIEKEEDVTEFLTTQTENMPNFVGLSFIKPDGFVQFRDGNEFQVQEKRYFEKALEGEIVFSDVFQLKQDKTQNVSAIFIPVINHDGHTIGVLSGVVNLSEIVSELVEKSELPGTVYLLKDDDVLYSSSTLSFEDTIPRSENFLNVIQNGKGGSWSDLEDDLRFIKYDKTWNDWVVVVDSVTNPATDEIRWTFLINMALVIGVILILTVIYIYLLRLQRRDKMRTEQDLLTGLGNRTRFEENIAKKRHHDPHVNITFYFIKLDRFSEVTEFLGYDVSDQLLFAISKRLNMLQRKFNVYRVGDEDFVITAPYDSLKKNDEFATEMTQRIAQPLKVKQEDYVEITASIGVRTANMSEETNIVMQDVLFTCLEARRRGGNQFVSFTEQLEKESTYQRQLTSSLANALENEEFYLVYQPIYSFSKDRIVSFEALMRWNSPLLGEISPIQFIPLLEDNEKIIDVGMWLIKEVANQVVQWEQAGHEDFTVALNISPKQLKSEHFLADVKYILSETGVTPSKLVFEVTESIVVQDTDVAYHILSSLNGLGIKTAIDDFGTGYSSLSLLNTLPFQYMKLDRAFVMMVLSDGGKSQAILSGLIEIANSLKLTTITEGVETCEQLEVLHKLGAHRIQGYYFSKPVVPERAVEFLKRTTVKPESN